MKQITIHIPDNKFKFFLELIKNLKFVRIVESHDTSTDKEIVKGIEDAVNEINKIKSGKKIAKPLDDFLNDL